jgi:heme/copper-type cytochrome/quinol oxidase subunit 2
VSGQLHAPAARPQGKSPRYPLDRMMMMMMMIVMMMIIIIIIIIIIILELK